MTARAVLASEGAVFQRLKRDLHLQSSTSDSEAEATIAAVVRRLSGFMCPCPKDALANAAVRSLVLRPGTREAVADQVDASIEALMIAGDLIELSKVVTSGAEDHPTWLYCAPPSFVKRADGRVYLFGVASDDAIFLPDEIFAQIRHLGATRYIDAPQPEALVGILTGLGLRQVGATMWMMPQHAETPERLLGRMTRRLQQHGVKGSLPEISILRHATSPALTYRQRWAPPKDETGLFIGRHPHPYGAALWYLCELQNGAVQRSLPLPLPEQPARACDVAWHIQLAIDADNGFAARIRTRPDANGEGSYLEVDFPLPMSAQRRLVLLGGGHGNRDSDGFSFWLPTSQLAEEVLALKEHFWYAAPNPEGTQ